MQPEATSHKPAAEGTRSQKPKASQKPEAKSQPKKQKIIPLLFQVGPGPLDYCLLLVAYVFFLSFLFKSSRNHVTIGLPSFTLASSRFFEPSCRPLPPHTIGGSAQHLRKTESWQAEHLEAPQLTQAKAEPFKAHPNAQKVFGAFIPRRILKATVFRIARTGKAEVSTSFGIFLHFSTLSKVCKTGMTPLRHLHSGVTVGIHNLLHRKFNDTKAAKHKKCRVEDERHDPWLRPSPENWTNPVEWQVSSMHIATFKQS